MPRAHVTAELRRGHPPLVSIRSSRWSKPRAYDAKTMFDRPILAFDIETIPDPERGRRVHGLTGEDAAVVTEMVARRMAETREASKYPPLPWHRVVCACVTELDPARGTVTMRALAGEDASEREIVAAFFAELERAPLPPRLVSWNGAGFDLPVLRYRALEHGIAAPGFHRPEARYGERREAMHVDVMDVLSGFGASPRPGLGSIAELVGLPGKRMLDREVYEHWLAGERARVLSYCKLDTLETLLVFLTWTLHTGSLPRDRLSHFADAARAAVAAEPDPAWTPIASALASWPPWP